MEREVLTHSTDSVCDGHSLTMLQVPLTGTSKTKAVSHQYECDESTIQAPRGLVEDGMESHSREGGAYILKSYDQKNADCDKEIINKVLDVNIAFSKLILPK